MPIVVPNNTGYVPHTKSIFPPGIVFLFVLGGIAFSKDSLALLTVLVKTFILCGETEGNPCSHLRLLRRGSWRRRRL